MLHALMVAVSIVSTVQAHGSYPSVADIEASFHFSPGTQLPRDVQAPDGTIYHSYYLSGHELGGGRYSVQVELRR